MALFGTEKSKGTKVVKAKKAVAAVKEPKKDVKMTAIVASALAGLIIRPLVTEKTARLGASGVYGFVVSNHATKTGIRAAILALYGIRPTRVAMMNYQGKEMRFKGRVGHRSSWKKAMVYLPEGKTIDVHQGV